MKMIRINAHIDSETLHLPQLRGWIGRDVEIIVQQRDDQPTEQKPTDRYPLRGSVRRFDDPLQSIDESDWEVLG